MDEGISQTYRSFIFLKLREYGVSHVCQIAYLLSSPVTYYVKCILSYSDHVQRADARDRRKTRDFQMACAHMPLQGAVTIYPPEWGSKGSAENW